MRRTQKLAPASQELWPDGLLRACSDFPLCFVLLWVGLAVAVSPNAARAESPDAGPLFDQFGLTLAPGRRTEAFGSFSFIRNNRRGGEFGQ